MAVVSQPDALRTVARELAALADGDRRAILSALDPGDRARILATLRDSGPADKTPIPSGEDTHSAWFDRLTASAGDSSNDAMTAAARAALIDAAGIHPPRPPRVPGRSLLEAAGGLLSNARTR